jgi:ferredoxin
MCIDACHEGAIALIDGKARLVKEQYCDGLGDCIGECPQDAITVEHREAEPYDEEAVKAHLAGINATTSAPSMPAVSGAVSCPGVAVRQLKTASASAKSGEQEPNSEASRLMNWPIQLHLVPPQAPYFQGADLLIAGDCVPFAMGNFHTGLLSGRILLIGCPKLDDIQAYVDKMSQIISINDITSIQVAHMEVPCCSGLVQAVRTAIAQSGKDIPASAIKISIDGSTFGTESLLV